MYMYMYMEVYVWVTNRIKVFCQPNMSIEPNNGEMNLEQMTFNQ